MSEEAGFDANLRDAFEPAYVLERELTGGGMSRVFLATERALNRKVVIKVLPPELAAGVNRERFRREIQLAAQLQHPHIVPLYSAGEHGDLLYYTMPFIEGESLKQAIHEHGKKKPFNLRDVVRILHDVSDALAYAHARGVIHRDIKPGNVLRSGKHAVVTDFGVAKAISASMPAVGMTTSGMAIGTPAYMAPEQLAGDPAADHRIDIYAVGLLAYELLTGEGPFNEASPQATLAAQMTRDPESVNRRRPDVPAPLAALVMKCLAKQPEQRPQTAQELVVELDAMAIGSGDFVPSALAPKRRRGALLGALALAAVAIVLVRKNLAVEADRKPKTDAIVTPKPAIAAAPATPALTRADSLSIADAVEKRMANRAAKTPPAVKIDSATLAAIRADVEKLVLDSLQKVRPPEPAQGSQGRARFPGGRGNIDFSGMTREHIDSIVRSARTMTNFVNPLATRHVIVADPPADSRRPDLQIAGTQVMDAVRKQLAGNSRYQIVNRDSTNAMLQRSRNRDSVMQALGGDMNISIRVVPSRADSLRWMVTLFDPTSQSRSTSVTIVAPASAAAAITDSIARLAMAGLFQLDHTPRRSAAPTPPQPPTAGVVPKPDRP